MSHEHNNRMNKKEWKKAPKIQAAHKMQRKQFRISFKFGSSFAVDVLFARKQACFHSMTNFCYAENSNVTTSSHIIIIGSLSLSYIR